MEGYLPRDFCPYARAFIRQYGDNDVLAIAESCDAMRRVYDVLRYWNLAGAVHFVDVPRPMTRKLSFMQELKGFASKLSDSGQLPRRVFRKTHSNDKWHDKSTRSFPCL